MHPEYSQVLVITANLFDIDGAAVGAMGENGVMYDYAPYVQSDTSIIDPRVKKVFYYGNIFLCLVNLDEAFFELTGMGARTANLEPLVASLFRNADRVSFVWMLRKKEDVECLTIPPIMEMIDGASGGASIGSRGG